MRNISGTHLLVDGYVEDRAALTPQAVTALFDELVELLGMEYVQRPMAVYVPEEPAKLDSDCDEGGWTIFAQITTSHISLHGWPLRKAFMLDLLSCREYDTDAAKELIYSRLGVYRACCEVVERRGPLM